MKKYKDADSINAALLGIICPMFAAAAIAAGPPGEMGIEELRLLSLEDLLNLKVTSVSKKPQVLFRAAAAVHVITSDEIRRSGATSIPEALRLAPGLQVARLGASTWAVSARGFNGPFANKLLVLLDGRTLYTPLFSGVFWDLQDTLLEDIDRIEVIPGTGRDALGRQCGQRRHQHHHQAGARDPRGLSRRRGRYGGTRLQLSPNAAPHPSIEH